MHDDNLEEEIFDGHLEISALERGATFGLDETTYYRMASCAMTAAGMRIEPAMIRTLPDGERGCKLILFGKTHAFSVVVRVSRSCTMITVFAEPLDGLRCQIPLYEGQDCDVHWSRALRSMCEVERIGFFDQHWAAEQGEGEAA